MSKRTSTSLVVLAAIAAIVVLLMWKWPRRDAPETPEALARLAVEALADGALERFRAATPRKADLAWAGGQLVSGQQPDGDPEVWEWVAAHSTGMPSDPRPFPTDWAVFEVLRRVAPAGLVGGDVRFVAVDSVINPTADKSALLVSHIRFRVAYGGDEYRFLAKACFPCPRGWICLEGLRYEGPVLASLATVVPGSLVFRFSLDEEEDAHLRDFTIRLLRDRLQRSTFRGAYIVSGGSSEFDVVLPGSYEERQEELVAVMTRRGSFMLRIEVLPEAEYRKLAEAAGVKPAHPALWPGSAAEFRAFKTAEIVAWRKAREEGVHYVQTRPGFLLVKAAGTDGSEAEHFHIVAHPAKATETINGSCLESAEASTDVRGDPVLVFKVKPAWQSAFWNLTRRNKGMPMAVVVEGEYLKAPMLIGPLRNDVLLNLGSGVTLQEAQEMAAAMAPVLGGPALPLTPKFVGLTRK